MEYGKAFKKSVDEAFDALSMGLEKTSQTSHTIAQGVAQQMRERARMLEKEIEISQDLMSNKEREAYLSALKIYPGF